jgi:RNA polymerase sigma-70 factor (ECF subfamily)
MGQTEKLIIGEIACLRRYARALTRDPNKADDLVQDCLERALSRLDMWKKGSNLKAWLLTIMHNIYANNIRRDSSTPSLVSIDDSSLILGTKATQETMAMMHDLNNALHKLPAEQREVFLLVTLEGMGYKEVSKIVNAPIGTVMSRLHRGRERLRQTIDSTATDTVSTAI